MTLVYGYYNISNEASGGFFPSGEAGGVELCAQSRALAAVSDPVSAVQPKEKTVRVVGASGLFFQRVTRSDLPCTWDSWAPMLQYCQNELFCIFPFKSHLKESPSGSLRAARGKRLLSGQLSMGHLLTGDPGEVTQPGPLFLLPSITATRWSPRN